MTKDALNWLPESTRDRIDQTVDEITRAMGDHVEAIALVGAAVHPERHDRARMPELLVVASETSAKDLHALAELVHDSMKDGVRLRVLTRDELERSADVFTIEVAEYKAQHVLLAGSDPFDDVSWSDADMRRSVEQGLRGLGRRVRNRVLSGLGTDGQRDDPQFAVAQGIDRFVVLARHALVLIGEPAPNREGDVIDAVGDKLGVKTKPLREHLTRIRKGRQLGDPLDAVVDLLNVLQPLVERIDAL
jgi:hypothetical protein